MIIKQAIGENKEDTILFVHGAWHGAWCWERHFMDYFAQQGYTNYAFTLRDHDKAGRVKTMNRHSINDYLEDLENIVNQLEKDPIIIGHSMGGLLVQKYLEKRPCKKAILLAPVPPSGVLRITISIILKKGYALPSLLLHDLFRLVNTPDKAKWMFLSDTINELELRYCQERLCSESFKAFLNMLWPRIRINFHKEVPMLVVGAANDRLFTLEEAKRTAEKYSADLYTLPNIAHDVMLDSQWENAAKAILDWIEQ